MSFRALPEIIQILETQPEWESLRIYRCLQDSWTRVVDPVAAQHSRPVSLTRGILWVATANSVWAQTLTLGRYQILTRLKELVNEPLKDIRFSTLNWRQTEKAPQQQVESPSLKAAIVSCPRCHCPTPVFEIERWSVCAFCIARQWGESSR